MSFSPLPDLFLEHLESTRLSSGRFLDLGCGDGSFSASLNRFGVRGLGLDRRGTELGTAAEVVGDVGRVPLRRRSQELVVAANLFRHIVSTDPLTPFLAHWQELLVPGGALFLFEDEPAERPGPAANYRDLQRFLGQLMPESRGPLMARAEFERCYGVCGNGGRWVFGSCRNEWPLAQDPILELLAGDGQARTGEPVRLLRSIERDGIAYGDYWWACWRNGPH